MLVISKYAILLSTTGALALCTGQGAFAQSGGNSTPAQSQSDEIQEVVVVAQRREQSVEKVPVTVSTFTALSLAAQGVDGTQALVQKVPGLQMNQSFNSGTPFLRGIGNPSGALGDEGAVAIYIDGVYISNLNSELFSFNNIKSVEVDKGPQGTLFGRNALGGVIQVFTNDPNEAFKSDVSIGYGNYSTLSAALYLGGKIADGLTGDLAYVGHNQQEGYGTNLSTGHPVGLSQGDSLRSKFIWRPSDRTKVTLAAYASRNEDTTPGQRNIASGVGGFTTPRFDVNFPRDPAGEVDGTGASVRVEQDMGWARLINTASTASMKLYSVADLDSQPINFLQLVFHGYDRSVTDELQLISAKGSTVDWVAGLFFIKDKAGYEHDGRLQTGIAGNLAAEGYEHALSYSAYAQATTPIFPTTLPNTNLTLGVRFTTDTRRLFAGQVLAGQTTQAPGYPVAAETKYDNVSYRVAIDHRLSSHAMLYGSYTTGFKAGLYNTNAPLDPSVRPETVAAWEAGLKSNWFSRKLTFEASAFYYDFDQIQLRSVTNPNAAGTTHLLNAASGISKGLDASLQVKPMHNLSIQAGVEFLSAKYTEFPNAPFSFYLSVPAGFSGTCGTLRPPGVLTACVGNASGNKMLQSPDFSGNVSVDYTLPQAIIPENVGRIKLSGVYSYTTVSYWEPDNRIQNPAHGVLNLSATWTSASGAYDLTVWGRNLRNAHYLLSAGSFPTGDIGYDATPRTYGLTIAAHY